jgi:RNA polymerase sigma factor (sigma-70 family)
VSAAASAHEHDADKDSTKAAARVAELFERHGRMVYGICRAMLRDVQEAEDATQQSFLSAHRALLGGARVRDSGAWMATIARNECRRRIVAGMRAPLPVADEDLGELPHATDEAERRLQAGHLREALAGLPERQREAVVLRYVYGLRYREVAKALGLSRPATEALLFRARRTMRVRLRHAAGAALVVPLSVREELALAVPGFCGQTESGAAAAGIAGGLLAKLASAPAAAKIATATVAVSTVGTVGAVESDRPVRSMAAEMRISPGTSGTARTPTPRSAERRDADEDGDGRGTGRGGAAPDASGDDGAGHGRENGDREVVSGNGSSDGGGRERTEAVSSGHGSSSSGSSREQDDHHGSGSSESGDVSGSSTPSESSGGFGSDPSGSGSEDVGDEEASGSSSSGSAESESESEFSGSGSSESHGGSGDDGASSGSGDDHEEDEAP